MAHPRATASEVFEALPELLSNGRQIQIGRDNAGGILWKFSGDKTWRSIGSVEFRQLMLVRFDLTFPRHGQAEYQQTLPFMGTRMVQRKVMIEALEQYADLHPRQAINREYDIDESRDSWFPGQFLER